MQAEEGKLQRSGGWGAFGFLELILNWEQGQKLGKLTYELNAGRSGSPVTGVPVSLGKSSLLEKAICLPAGVTEQPGFLGFLL